MTNKTVSMTIAEIEKSSQEFKKAHKIKVSGPYDDEDMPKWFKAYAVRTDARLERLENEVPKWFKEYAERTDARLDRLENEMPKWFKKWVETDYKPFKELVIDQFVKHGWIKK